MRITRSKVIFCIEVRRGGSSLYDAKQCHDRRLVIFIVFFHKQASKQARKGARKQQARKLNVTSTEWQQGAANGYQRSFEAELQSNLDPSRQALPGIPRQPLLNPCQPYGDHRVACTGSYGPEQVLKTNQRLKFGQSLKKNPAHMRGCPSCAKGETGVVSTASCVPRDMTRAPACIPEVIPPWPQITGFCLSRGGKTTSARILQASLTACLTKPR